MRPLEPLLLLVNLLSFLTLVAPLHWAPRWTGPLALLGLVVTVTQVWLEGARWQMVPAYVLAGAFLVVWALPLIWPTVHLAEGLFVGLTVVLAALALGVSIALPLVLARQAKLPAFAYGHLAQIVTNAVVDAPVADGQESYPVLVFLEGLTGFRQHNTFQVQELVSQGYVVAALDQPYAAGGVVFPDGRVVQGWDGDAWAPLWHQSVNPTDDPPVLNGTSLPRGIMPYLAEDAGFALDRLTALNADDEEGALTGRLDLGRVGLVGVSLGAIVGAEACRAEARFAACLLMEAPMPADVVEHGLQQPTMWITTDPATMHRERWPDAEVRLHLDTMRAVFESLPAPATFVQVHGMFHLNLTDFPRLFSPLTSRLGLTGPIDGRSAHAIINAYTVAFFDRRLRDRSAPLLDEQPPPFDEVRVRRRLP